MIGGKKITGNDIRHAIPRNNWATGTVYKQYDHRDTDMFNIADPIYVVTSAFSVYKCISNNGGSASTIEPSAINSQNTIQTADGYIWKFMYNLSDQDLLRFTTTNYVPVKTLSSTDGTLQWLVQENAINGGIHNIIVDNPGSNYSNSANLIITVTGDGAGIQTLPTVNTAANTLQSILVTSPGVGYSFASISITGGGGSGAAATAIISPPGGHGSDPVNELGGSYLVLNPQLIRDENGVLPASNDYRKIALLLNPLDADGVTPTTNSAFFQGYTLATTGSGDYIADETVYQGKSLDESTFSATVLTWDSANGITQVINAVGTPAAGTVVGVNSSTTRFLTSSIVGDLAKYSGQILYLDNLGPIIRAADQTESFQILLKF